MKELKVFIGKEVKDFAISLNEFVIIFTDNTAVYFPCKPDAIGKVKEVVKDDA